MRQRVAKPLKTTNWITVEIAIRLTHLTESEILAAVDNPANSIDCRSTTIGGKKFLLINREPLLNHFAKQPVPAA